MLDLLPFSSFHRPPKIPSCCDPQSVARPSLRSSCTGFSFAHLLIFMIMNTVSPTSSSAEARSSKRNRSSILFFISHLTRRIEIGRDNIAHRIPIYAPFRKSTAIAATNEVVFRLSHDFTIITDHTQVFSATLLCSKIYGLDYAATYLNFKKPQYNCSSIIHNLSKAQ